MEDKLLDKKDLPDLPVEKKVAEVKQSHEVSKTEQKPLKVHTEENVKSPTKKTANNTKNDKSNLNLLVAILLVTNLVSTIIAVVLGISLLDYNSRLESQRQIISQENLRLNSETNSLESNIESLVNNNDELRYLLENDSDSSSVEQNESCIESNVNIGIASYKVSCDWSSFFQLSYNNETTSVGFIDRNPIIAISQTDSRPSQVIVSMTRYSDDLNNYLEDPISGLVSEYSADGLNVDSFTNPNGVVMYRVSQTNSSGTIINHYSQTDFNGDIYLVRIEDVFAKEGSPLDLVIDSFNWNT